MTVSAHHTPPLGTDPGSGGVPLYRAEALRQVHQDQDLSQPVPERKRLLWQWGLWLLVTLCLGVVGWAGFHLQQAMRL